MPTLPAFLAVLLSAFSLLASAAPPAITLQPFVTGLASPVEITNADDSSGRLFVVELGGKVRVIRNGQVLPTPFLDISAGNGGPVHAVGEGGLLGLAFHPSYATNGRFFVYYTRVLPGDANGNEIVIARYERSAGNADVADPASGAIVLVISHPQQSNHNGGKLAFGFDGYLYAGVGDGGGGGDPFATGQSLTQLRGKILRLDVDGVTSYVVPPSNPFANDPSVRGEIWAYGLRNPWRFSFDRLTGDLLIGDVGQGAWEEIDFEPFGSAGGRNYGWSVFEGTHCFNPSTGCSLAGHTLPIIEYGHNSTGGNSVTGGYRYRGSGSPALAGYYVYGDFVSGRIWAAAPDSGGTWISTQIGSLSNLSTFGEDESGELYAANISAGTIHRVVASGAITPHLSGVATRGRVLTGDNVMIGGFIIGGSAPKTVIVRARGPSLAAQGVAGVLADPTLTLVPASGPTVTNDDWGTAANAAAVTASGFAPTNPKESAILATLNPGAYTAIVSGVGGGTGVGLVEVYELDHPEIPMTGIATRGFVQTGDNVLIGGFVIQGDTPQTVVIRARGPSMSSQGVANVLANPTLTLVPASGPTVTNDDWGTAANAAAVTASGFAPTNPLESAILITLNPGAYTAIVSGVGGGTGVGIVEVYATP
jgi:hypothetical protein